jgi:molybdopterin-guanine dinucleotide biosynthesis protein A
MPPATAEPAALGAILAGGASRRFGAPKALAELRGVPIVERLRAALEGAGTRPVIIGSRPELAALPLPRRPDGREGGGPLAGVEAALRWASELGLPGALCVGCDLPFLPAGLLRAILDRGLESGSAAVAPVSPSGAGWEPLCAWYTRGALPVVEERLGQGRLSLHGLLDALRAEPVPGEVVARFGRPESIFLNVNTAAELRRAERLAAEEEGTHGG